MPFQNRTWVLLVFKCFRYSGIRILDVHHILLSSTAHSVQILRAYLINYRSSTICNSLVIKNISTTQKPSFVFSRSSKKFSDVKAYVKRLIIFDPERKKGSKKWIVCCGSLKKAFLNLNLKLLQFELNWFFKCFYASRVDKSLMMHFIPNC
jgi:hypothetical protein